MRRSAVLPAINCRRNREPPRSPASASWEQALFCRQPPPHLPGCLSGYTRSGSRLCITLAYALPYSLSSDYPARLESLSVSWALTARNLPH